MGYLGTGALGVSMPSAVAHMDAQLASANYIAQDALAAGLGLYSPQVDPMVERRYGRDDLSGLLTSVQGYHKAVVGSMTYWHYEKDFIHGTLRATCPGAAAGVAATFTLTANSKEAIEYASIDTPYISTSEVDTIVPSKFQILQLPGADRIELMVTSVDVAAGTFVAIPIDPADAIPALAGGTQEIIIKGNAQAEFSDEMPTRTSRLLTYKNNLTEHRSDFKASERGMATVTYIENFGYSDGSKGNVYYLEGMSDEYQRFNNECEMMLFDGKSITNPTLANTAGFETVIKGEGLVTTIETSGTNVPYTTLALADLDTANLSLLKYKGDKTNLLLEGYTFQSGLNKLARNGDGVEFGGANTTARTNWAITDRALDLDFDKITYNGFTWIAKPVNTFEDPTTLGAAGQTYRNMAIGLPVSEVVTYNEMNVAGSSERARSIRVRYLQDSMGHSNFYKEWSTGSLAPNGLTPSTGYSIHMNAKRGLELFSANRTILFNK